MHHKLLMIRNGSLVSVSLRRRAFSHLFFDRINVGQKTTLARANWIEDNAVKHPEHASELELALDGRLVTLDS